MSNTWMDVLDPRDDANPCTTLCVVEVSENTWRKIATKHATGRIDPGEKPLWGEWLEESRAGRFRALWDSGIEDGDRTATLADVSTVVEGEAKRCLGVPLAVLYGEFPPPPARGNPRDAWSLVLPCGALLAVQPTTPGGEVQSCYFKSAVCREPNPHNRWRVLAEKLTLTYAERVADGTWAPRQMTSRDDITVVRIRFRHPTTWALDRNDPTPWERIPDPYHPPAAPPRRLGPRRPC